MSSADNIIFVRFVEYEAFAELRKIFLDGPRVSDTCPLGDPVRRDRVPDVRHHERGQIFQRQLFHAHRGPYVVVYYRIIDPLQDGTVLDLVVADIDYGHAPVVQELLQTVLVPVFPVHRVTEQEFLK